MDDCCGLEEEECGNVTEILHIGVFEAQVILFADDEMDIARRELVTCEGFRECNVEIKGKARENGEVLTEHGAEWCMEFCAVCERVPMYVCFGDRGDIVFEQKRFVSHGVDGGKETGFLHVEIEAT